MAKNCEAREGVLWPGGGRRGGGTRGGGRRDGETRTRVQCAPCDRSAPFRSLAHNGKKNSKAASGIVNAEGSRAVRSRRFGRGAYESGAYESARVIAPSPFGPSLVDPPSPRVSSADQKSTPAGLQLCSEQLGADGFLTDLVFEISRIETVVERCLPSRRALRFRCAGRRVAPVMRATVRTRLCARTGTTTARVSMPAVVCSPSPRPH